MRVCMCICRQGPYFCQNLIYVCVGSVYSQGFGLDGASSCPQATPPLSASGIPPLHFSSPDLGPQPGNHGLCCNSLSFPQCTECSTDEIGPNYPFLPFYPGTKTPQHSSDGSQGRTWEPPQLWFLKSRSLKSPAGPSESVLRPSVPSVPASREASPGSHKVRMVTC